MRVVESNDENENTSRLCFLCTSIKSIFVCLVALMILHSALVMVEGNNSLVSTSTPGPDPDPCPGPCDCNPQN